MTEKKNKSLKVIGIIGSLLIVAALCIASSRFSWFGTHAVETASEQNESSLSSVSPDSAASYETPAPEQDGDDSVSSDENSVNSSETSNGSKGNIGSETSDSADDTESPEQSDSRPSAPQTEKKPESSAAPSTTKTQTTTQTTAPAPRWTETECKAVTMYVTVDCYSRKEAVLGAEIASSKRYGEAVKVVATTDTGYSKLDDGTFIHGDYLSRTKPAATVTTTVTKPSETPSGDNGDINASKFEQEVFRLVNEARVQYGLPAYKWDSKAYAAAKIRCKEIMTNFSHDRNGQKFSTVYGDISSLGLRAMGENIAAGQSTPEKVMNAWMNSPSHRANILSEKFEYIAVAYDETGAGYNHYWAQEFTAYH